MSKEKQCKCCKEYWWEMNIHSQSGLCPNCYDYVADLEAKLAEKERVCDWLDNVLKEYAKQEELLSHKLKSLGVDCIEDLSKHQNQDKISFAVEKLNEVKENLLNFPAVTYEDIKILKKKQKEHFDKRLMDFCKHNLNFIDNQIKTIKGEK